MKNKIEVAQLLKEKFMPKAKNFVIGAGAALMLVGGLSTPISADATPISQTYLEVGARSNCAITHWFINGTTFTPYRHHVGGPTIGNIPNNTRITRIYSTSGSYSNIRVANNASVPRLFRGGSGWVLSNRVSGFRPEAPCVATP